MRDAAASPHHRAYAESCYSCSFKRIMDFVVEKIQELGVSKPLSKGRPRKRSQDKPGMVDNGSSRSPLTTGCEKLRGRLRMQSRAVKSSLSKPRSCLPGHLPESDSSNPGTLQRVKELKLETMRDFLPSLAGNISTTTGTSIHVDPQQYSVDSYFIQAVTVPELVCGVRRYKCLGCLRYHEHLASLLEHVRQGWMQGFSCRVFYHKLRSMHEHGGGTHGHAVEVFSRVKTQLSDPSLAVSRAETHESCGTRDQKTDLICKWLQMAEIRAVPE